MRDVVVVPDVEEDGGGGSAPIGGGKRGSVCVVEVEVGKRGWREGKRGRGKGAEGRETAEGMKIGGKGRTRSS